MVVADRANARLQYFSADGKHLGFFNDMLFPADIDLRGDVMLVSDYDNQGVVKLNNGSGNFNGNGGRFGTSGNPIDVALVDVNGDGAADFLGSPVASVPEK